MNYLTNMKNVIKLSQQELYNTSGSSWHDQYKNSAWIFVGGLPFDLTEGDLICIFSQYGEVVNINLIRAKDTGKSKGFCFLCYEDQRSTILAVDNLNGIKILNRSIRVDHVQDYKVPKEDKKANEETKNLYAEGCAPKPAAGLPKIELQSLQVRETLADQIEGEMKLPARLPIYTSVKTEQISDTETEKAMKKKQKDKNKKKRKSESSSNESNSSESESDKNVKTERCSSAERGRKNRKNKDKERDKYSNEYNKSSTSKYTHSDKSDHSSNKTKNKSLTSPKRRDRSRSRDKDQKVKSYKRDVSPNIPKRWR